jgi:hypothetical protein
MKIQCGAVSLDGEPGTVDNGMIEMKLPVPVKRNRSAAAFGSFRVFQSHSAFEFLNLFLDLLKPLFGRALSGGGTGIPGKPNNVYRNQSNKIFFHGSTSLVSG